jgi:uncharacterized protein (TIGR00299 family) protein
VVEHQPEHHHRHLRDIIKQIETASLTQRQQELAKRIFFRLAEAEAKVHGTTIEKVHFHEIGAADSIADIVGTAVGWEMLGIERAVASPVAVGCGRITIAHGQCSVPAPATAELLRGVPLAPCNIEAELTTPTGAAILATLVDSFGPLPAMRIKRIGYGAGQKDLPQQPNVLRLMLGESVELAVEPSGWGRLESDEVCLLETNLDDQSGELVGYCAAQLWQAGALDVYTTAIQMKKGRPGVKLTVICHETEAERLTEIILAETSTLGVRRWRANRRLLPRRPHAVETRWGMVEGKVAWLGNEAVKFSPEFESCQRIAVERQLPLRAVYEAALRAFDPTKVQGQCDP